LYTMRHNKQIASQSPRSNRKALTSTQELELKSHLCLLFAAKIEETDDIQGTSDRIPHCMMLKELRKAARYQFPREDYLREEGPTFNALSWSMMCITPYHFLHSLTSMGLVYEDDRVSLPKDASTSSSSLDTEKILERVRFHAEAYLDSWLRKTWCILFRSTRRYRPSVIALSCVLAARKSVGIVPILSERMKELALLEECYEDDVYEEIGECYEFVCNTLVQGGRKKAAAISKNQYLTANSKNASAPKVKSQVSTCDRSPN